ncbi:putative quinol monooxygenase [Shewanella pealeana]|uniref:Antibiotic biosynthesis monooxygenase n=1 Tax=Shewanella pealeana (strain ATCC 700345 / ANG-SQ1) TaxID=398579 RepID=A8H6T4_SHEPA|nr:putative quinol monooxygenase [Shewanella pealeana]ABV88271.1 Antibiotic biosynthesis monooxygenase [Shewanella pealeana ATCC 700345]
MTQSTPPSTTQLTTPLTTPLTIVANITAHADKVEIVKAELIKVIATTREEKGCLQYDLHQDNENPAHFTFYENWASREDLKAHLNTQHIKDYVAVTEGMVKEFTLNEMTLIG